jgi:hypothetical protein
VLHLIGPLQERVRADCQTAPTTTLEPSLPTRLLCAKVRAHSEAHEICISGSGLRFHCTCYSLEIVRSLAYASAASWIAGNQVDIRGPRQSAESRLRAHHAPMQRPWQRKLLRWNCGVSWTAAGFIMLIDVANAETEAKRSSEAESTLNHTPSARMLC